MSAKNNIQLNNTRHVQQNKCSNYLLCNQFVNKNVNNNFCKDCLFYFNYKMIFKINNKDNLTCPICLCSPTLFIKQKNCNHHICIECVHNVYFDKSFVRNMPHNPIKNLKKSWDLYIYSNQATIFKKHFINIYSNGIYNDHRYINSIEKYKFLIPSIFRKNIKSLIQFQLEKNNYVCEYKTNQYDKIKMLKICPYCRSSSNFTKFNNGRVVIINNTNQTTL